MKFKNREEMSVAHNSALNDLRQGKFDQAANIFEALATQLPVPGYVNSLGTALALSDRWDLAIKEFERARSLPPDRMTNSTVGVAKWCLDQREAACSDWYNEIERIKTKSIIFTDAAGGVIPAALLWWASSYPDLKHWRAKAVSALKERCRTRKTNYEWPAHIALYLLSNISQEELFQGVNLHSQKSDYIAIQAQFYCAATLLNTGKEDSYLAELSDIAKSPIPMVITEEYLLARYETK